MDLSLSDEQQLLKDTFAAFFGRESTSDAVRAAEPLGFHEPMWRLLQDTGAPLVGVPADLGGGGAGIFELALVAMELGRRIAPVPLVETAVAANLLARLSAEGILAQVVDGSALATVALRPARAGVTSLVPAGAVADVVIVLEGDRLVALRDRRVDRGPAGAPSNLGSAPLADWTTDGSAIGRTVIADGGSAIEEFQNAISEWKILAAAVLTGIGARALDLGVSYVKDRRAFGAPIGWFQAVQHRLADLAVAGDGAELLALEAAWAWDEHLPTRQQLASMAFLFSSEVACRTSRESLQFHGGYGFTLDYDIQLYFRRAKAWSLSLGDPRREYQRLANHLYPQQRSVNLTLSQPAS